MALVAESIVRLRVSMPRRVLGRIHGSPLRNPEHITGDLEAGRLEFLAGD